MFLKIEAVNNQIKLLLLNDERKKVSKLEWRDNRDLSEKLLVKIDCLLRKNNLNINNISKINFSGKNCGFMAEQVGKITAKILNF